MAASYAVLPSTRLLVSVAMLAVLLLVLFQDDPAALVERLHSDDLDVRADAAERLLAIGVAAIPVLEQAAGDAEVQEILARLRVRARFSAKIVKEYPDLMAAAENGDESGWAVMFHQAVYRIDIDARDIEAILERAVASADDPRDAASVLHAALQRKIPVSDGILRDLIGRTLWSIPVERERLVGLVRDLLASDDPEDRERALIGASWIDGSPDLLDVAARRIGDRDSRVLRLLAFPEARPHAALVAVLLADASPDVVAQAVRTLARMEADEYAADIEVLLGSPDSSVRASAAEAMGWMGQWQAFPRLLQLVEDPDTTYGAASAIGRLGPAFSRALLPYLTHENPDVADSVATSLVRPTAMAELTEYLEMPDVRIRRIAADLLVRMGSRSAMEILAQHVRDADPIVRATVLRALPDDAWTKEMVAAVLKDVCPDVRAGMTRLAAGLEMWQELRALVLDESASVKVALCGRYRAADTVEVLIPLLEDADLAVVEAAAKSISTWSPSAPHIARLLLAPDPVKRRIGLECLTSIADAPALATAMVKAYESADAGVRARAVAAGLWLAEPAFGPLAVRAMGDASAEVRHFAREILLDRADEKLLQQLVPALSSSDEETRFGAAFVLANAAEGALLDSVSRLKGDASPRVQRAAIRAMGQRGDEAGLAELAKDADAGVRASAVAELVEFDAETWVPVLLDGDGPLLALNAIRQPREWARVRRMRLNCRGDHDAWDLLLSSCCKHEGEPVMKAPQALTLAEGLETVLGSKDDLILDDEGPRVVTREEARAYWKAWWADR